MKTLLACLVVLAATSCLAAEEKDRFSKVEIKVTHVAGSVYLLEGEGGNIGASIGEDGIVIVDDQYAPLADKIRAALKGVADQPVRFVINTHYHGDHAGGNIAFQEEASIIAHENVRKRLGASAENPKEALPIITFQHDVSVHLNGEDIRALHAPHGHTDGDSLVFFTKSNVVHMGDMFVRYGFPYIDMQAGGTVSGMIHALEHALEELPADVKVIPGHGALATIADVKTFLVMLKDTRAAVEKEIEAGKSLEQMKQENVLSDWQNLNGPFIKADDFIETLHADITGAQKGKWRKHN
jgi:glyoxylase-like metal-dependent hydrolase (beta-lactamase superfamily II)